MPSLSHDNLYDLHDLWERTTQTTEYLIHRRIKYMQRSATIPYRDYNALHDLLVHLQQPSVFMQLRPINWNPRMDSVALDVSRLFLHYLASSVASIEYTKKCMDRWFRDIPFKNDYDFMQQELTTNKLFCFNKALRNLAMHDFLPMTGTEGQFSQLKHEQFNLEWWFVVYRDALKPSIKDYGNKKAREYLGQCDEHIRVDKLIQEHFALISDFHKNVITGLVEYYSEQLQWLQTIRERVKPIWDWDTQDESSMHENGE